MENSWVMVRKDSNKWIFIAVSLIVVILGIIELLKPGTLGLILSDFIDTVRRNWGRI